MENIFRIVNQTETEAEITIYGQIGEPWWFEDEEDYMGLKRFKKIMDKIKNVNSFTIRINSPGGSVFDGIGIYNLIKAHKASTKKIIIDGMAASIASVIALAGTELVMGEGTMIMIHNPATCVCGEAKDMRKAADILDSVRDQIVSIYVARTNLEKDKLVQMMEDETWFGAEEAIEWGFADSVTSDAENFDAAACANISWIKNAPKQKEIDNKLVAKQNREAYEASVDLQKEIRNFLAHR